MKLLHLSDTHNQHRALGTLPPADVLIHTGDFTMSGSDTEAYDFMNWFCDLPYAHKIFIAGNHDDCLYGAEGIDGLPPHVHYLCNSGVEIEGVHFYGIPMFIPDIKDGKMPQFLQQIPDQTDVLLTHQPPYSVCDLADYGSGLAHRGDKALWQRIEQLHLHFHLFGHEHDANGVVRLGKTVYSNGALLNHEFVMYASPRTLVYR